MKAMKKDFTQKQSDELLPGGVWPTMLTPFLEDKQIDWVALDELIEWYLQSGVAGFFAVCLSSEMFALSWKERLAIARHVVVRCAGRVPVVAGGIVDTPLDRHGERLRQMADTGVAAVVCVVNQLAQEGESDVNLRRNMDALLAQTQNIALGLYECPTPYHRLLTVDSLEWAALTGRFLFLKETSGNIESITDKIAAIRDTPLLFLNAHGGTVLESLRVGADGYCSIAANFYPWLFVWLCENFENQPQLAEDVQQFLTIANDTIIHEYPVSAKVFLRLHGLQHLKPYCRVCDWSPTEAETKALAALESEAARWYEKLHDNCLHGTG